MTTVTEGGCWFCEDHEAMGNVNKFFSTEWDAFYHLHCCLIAARDSNVEAATILELEWELKPSSISVELALKEMEKETNDIDS